MKPVDSKVLWVVAQEVILAPEITYFDGFGQGGSET